MNVYQWLKSKVESVLPSTDSVIEEEKIATVGKVKLETNEFDPNEYIELCINLSKIKKNSIWELLSNFTVITDTIVPIKVRKEFKFFKFNGMNEVRSPFWSLRKYQGEMYMLYVLHKNLEADIMKLLSSVNDYQLKEQILNEFSSFIPKTKNTSELLGELIRSFCGVLDNRSSLNIDLVKVPICKSIMELTIGIRTDNEESIPLSVLSCKTFVKKEEMVIDKDSIKKLLGILIEKKICLKKTIDYFEQLNNLIIMIPKDSIEVYNRVRSMVPLKTVNILLKKCT